MENLLRFSDKTSARQAAIEAGVPVVPGSDGALGSAEEVVEFVEGIGLPVILKVRRIKSVSKDMFTKVYDRKNPIETTILDFCFLGGAYR